MRVSVIQFNSSHEREANLKSALRLIDKAAAEGAKFVILPECATFLGAYEKYSENSELIDGSTFTALAGKARQHKITIHSGSLIERSSRSDRFYNTSLLINPRGELVASYRKVHLFDVDVPGKVTESESSVVLPGDHLVVVKLPEFVLGMSICFDLRFPELYRALALAGAEVLVIPSAFARGTGEAHWHILVRARAIENHAYVLASGQYGPDADGHFCYGHSLIVDPWGGILAEAPAEEEAVLVADIDLEQVHKRREQIPVLQGRKPEAYTKVDLIQTS
jgi:deaminated glutathione amidase